MRRHPASIKVRALQWLAQREHSRSELRDKLLRLLKRGALQATGATLLPHASAEADWGADSSSEHAEPDAIDPAAQVEALLVWLESHGYLSQDRFIESRVRARQGRYGDRRIQQELGQHGLSLDAAARQALQQSEFDRACAVWRKKYGVPAADAAARARQLRFLAARGFSLPVVRRVVLRGTGSDDAAAPFDAADPESDG